MRQNPVNRKFVAEVVPQPGKAVSPKPPHSGRLGEVPPPITELRAETFFWPWPAFPVGAFLLLVSSFFYVWLRVEPHLEYHSYGPYFYRQQVFMETFLGRPGGLASYAGVFLAQLNCLSWLGALVFALSGGVIILATLFCLFRISGKVPGFLALVPVFVLLLLRNRYGCPVSDLIVGLNLALVASAAFVSLPWRRAWWSMAISGLISGLLFFLAGLWAALLFGFLCGLFVWVQMRKRLVGLGCLVLSLAAPLLHIGTGRLEIGELINPWPEGVDWILAAVLYASVPVAAAVLAIIPKPSKTPLTSRAGHLLQAPGSGQAVVVLALLLGWAALWLTFDRRQKHLAEMDYYASNGQYEAVLVAASQVLVLNEPARVRLQLALYHTGRLAEELFSFHNLLVEGESAGIGKDRRAQIPALIELGLINDAEHMAYEALEMEGERPDLLRLLARIHQLKDQPQAAQVFLNVLSLIPFEGERENQGWPAIGPQISTAERANLARMHALALTNDLVHEGVSVPVARLLEFSLASNPTNQMAFEYLMADYLLDLDLKQVVGHLGLLDKLSYPQIPRPYEEAVLLFQHLERVPVALKGRKIRPETEERFRRFKEAASQYLGGTGEKAAMIANFGDTYWCYYIATRSRWRAAEAQASTP